jgi:hypothetical protein
LVYRVGQLDIAPDANNWVSVFASVNGTCGMRSDTMAMACFGDVPQHAAVDTQLDTGMQMALTMHHQGNAKCLLFKCLLNAMLVNM